MNQENVEQIQQPEEQYGAELYGGGEQPTTKVVFPFHCPECGEGFEQNKWMGAHRFRAHGVKGTSKSARTRWKPTSEQKEKYAETARKKYLKKKREEQKRVMERANDENRDIQQDVIQEAANEPAGEKYARERHLAYAFGHCEAWAKIYAESVGLPSAEFAQELGELFRSQSRRKVLGS